jgi:SnoaL-like domain
MMKIAGVETGAIERRLWDLESERTIRDLVHRYCDAADRRDWARFKSVFHAESTHKHGDIFEGRSLDFAALGEAVFKHVPETHHQIGNVMVRVSDGTAVSQCYFIAHHLIPNDAPTELFPRHRVGVEEDWWVGGRYLDKFEYRNQQWGIVHREAVHDWERWEIAEGRGFIRSINDAPGVLTPLGLNEPRPPIK